MVIKAVVKTKTPQGKAKPAVKAATSDGELGTFTGTIKSFSDKTWYGFIVSEDVSAAGYGDVFLNGDEKRGYQPGQTVKFTCTVRDGKPVASHLRSGLKDGNAGPSKSHGKGGGKSGYGGGKSGYGGGGDIWSTLTQLLGSQGGKGQGKGGYIVDSSGGVLGEFIGTIKSFNEKTKYGFIESPDMFAAGYGDAFLHGEEKKGYQPGQLVRFTCVLNSEGRPQATGLRSGLKGGYGGDGNMMSTLTQLLGSKGGQGKGGYQGGFQQKAKTFKVDKSGGELGEFTGTIKSFSDKKFYGFIESPDVSAAGYGDIFLHGDEKKGYRQGQTVKFTCVLNKDGKPVATNLTSGLK